MTTKIWKIFLLVIAAVSIVASAEDSYAFVIPTPGYGDAVPEVSVSCEKYPGFINKIVKCITHIVERETIEGMIDRVHAVFVQASNVAIVLYIMFFGLKLMLGGVENAKSEIFIVTITAILILYMNNTTRIMDVMDMFLLGQSEFANAATAAITTSPMHDGGTASELICVGPFDKNGNPIDKAGNVDNPNDNVPRMMFTTWQRVDCVIAYILGVHPLIEFTSQYFEENDTEENLGGAKARYDYAEFATDRNPFANMAEDPYKFLTGPDAQVTESAESFMAFSMITIMVGMLFSESMGIIVIMTGFFIIMLMIAAFGQAVLIYLTSLFAIVVLATFAPIILPMFLFRQTRRVFDFWLQMFFTYMLQPGIMLAYLTFMLFVLQYVMDYSGDGVDSRSLIEYHFGEIYKNADKQGYQLMQFSKDTDTSYQENSSSLADVTTQYTGAVSDYHDLETTITTTLLGNSKALGDEGVRDIAEQNRVFDTLYKSFSGSDTNLSMMSNSGFSIPGYKFDTSAGGELKQKMSNILNLPLIGDTFMNPSEFLKMAQENPLIMDVLTDAQKQKEQEEFTHAVSYMQVLLVVFLTMSVTFAFMQNVMAFGSEMAGAGTLPVNQMVNIYNGYTGKMARSLK